MEFRKVLALRGPNIWTNSPVLEVWVDLKELDRPSTDFPGFNDRADELAADDDRAPVQHRRAGRVLSAAPRRHLPRPHPRTRYAWSCSRWSAEKSGSDGPARPRRPAFIAWLSSTMKSGWRGSASMSAANLVLAAIHDRPFDVKAEIDRLRDFAQEVCLGPSTGAIVDAATARGIPAWRMNSESMVQLGHGAKQRRIRAAETDRTGAIAEAIAQDKELTRTLLKAVGVPVPEGRPVSDADDAWAAAVRDRRAGGGQASRRQPGPRRGHESHHARADHGRLSGGACREQASRRGEVRAGPRLPPARCRQPRSSPPPAASRPRCWATASTPSANWSSWPISIPAAANTMRPC